MPWSNARAHQEEHLQYPKPAQPNTAKGKHSKNSTRQTQPPARQPKTTRRHASTPKHKTRNPQSPPTPTTNKNPRPRDHDCEYQSINLALRPNCQKHNFTAASETVFAPVISRDVPRSAANPHPETYAKTKRISLRPRRRTKPRSF